MMSDASEMLAAALEQMDGIIAGSKAMDYSNGLFDCQSPTSPFLGGLRVLHLLEDLRGALELMDNEERDNLRCQIPDSTAEGLAEWLHGRLTNGHGSQAVYQERLSRLESDKECLILQELLNRSALETQKLELMTEVSSLKLKLTAVERDHRENEGLYQEVTDLRFRVTDIENERLQCEKKLKATKVSVLASLYLVSAGCSIRAMGRETKPPTSIKHLFVFSDTEVLKMKRVLESLASSNDEKERRIKELEESLTKCKKVQELVKGQTVFKDHTPGPGFSPPTKANTASDDSFGTKKARSSFGRGFFKLRAGKQTASTPNLAETDRKGTEHLDLAGVPPRKSHDGAPLPSSPETKKKSKGFRKFFGRWSSGGAESEPQPALDSAGHVNLNTNVPFSRWSKDEVCAWLHEQGLGLYVAQCHSWIKSGQTLLQASQHDLEKELCMKQPLHRKKLQLALQALGSEEDDFKGKLDHNWVTRWLDDIGLPQYKSHFDEARIKFKIFYVDDLLSLKVGSVLHHLSIKRAVQVLRLNSYEPNCLRRRPSDENNITPAEISQWTNHRVMEWLRSVDLAEYAPNLRGSGVHGGLMVLEPRFNVEALALLLNIPPNKTLLRRHLATHFHLLIGSEAQRLKQDCLENPDYTVLTATAKVKPRRMSFGGFGTLRKKRQDDGEEYVCPMNVEMPKSSSFQRGVQIYEENLDHLEQMEDSEGTVRQIGAFSEGINNLTVRHKAAPV
uniref:SAM domain-containing protein n=1 Tax=Dicentrarchus labrax TaxID=13489 RepID=A0A8C4I2W8_DICLA